MGNSESEDSSVSEDSSEKKIGFTGNITVLTSSDTDDENEYLEKEKMSFTKVAIEPDHEKVSLQLLIFGTNGLFEFCIILDVVVHHN